MQHTGCTAHLYNIHVPGHAAQWTSNEAEEFKGEKQVNFSTNEMESFSYVASDLAQRRKTVTKANVGNKQQVTQMYTSHAT